MQQRLVRHGLTLLVVILLFTGILLPFLPPKPRATSAPAGEFSAMRAVQLLERFARETHPIGSDGLARSQAAIVDILDEMGLESENQSATGALSEYGVAGYVQNIIARLPGTEAGQALLLVAHYDSVPVSPAAGDNGSGVVAILESARALQAGPVLKNDVILLFTDGEEVGTLGAHAFAQQHPWMEHVAAVLNIEGSLTGPAVWVESGPNNGFMLKKYQRAVSQPVGYSWTSDLFQVMPFLTDFVPFKEAGLPGGNIFSPSGGTQYHTPRDSIENLSKRSLQHLGDQTLALTRAMGNADLSQAGSLDVVYFNLWGPLMIRYPYWMVIPIALIAVALFMAALMTGLQSGQLTWRGMRVSSMTLLGSVIVSAMVASLLWSLVQTLLPGMQINFSMATHRYNDWLLALGFLLLTSTIYGGANSFFRNQTTQSDLAMGSLWFWLFLTLATSFVLPGFSYLMSWPLLFNAGMMVLRFRLRAAPMEGAQKKTAWLWILGAAPAALLWLPVVWLLFFMVGLNMLSVLAVAWMLAMSALMPAISGLLVRINWKIPAVLLVSAVLSLIIGGIASGYSPEQPRPTGAWYVLDADSEQSYWVNALGPLSPWEESFFPESIQESTWSEIFAPWSGPTRYGPAPAAPLAPAQIELLARDSSPGGQSLRIHITSPELRDMLMLGFPPGSRVEQAMLDGEVLASNPMLQAQDPERWLLLQIAALPEEGAELQVTLTNNDPLELLVAAVERGIGFEALERIDVPERPADTMSVGDSIMVIKRYLLEEKTP